MASRKGLFLGFHRDESNGQLGGEAVYSGKTHALLYGPSGCGKGSRLLMPNLLDDYLSDHSIVVIDPKGELAAVTAEYQRKKLGRRVVIINPFNVLGLGSEGFNPLAGLSETDPTFFDDAAALADALIQIQGTDPHWSESAQGLLLGLIMWEVIVARRERGRPPQLSYVREMLTEPEAKGVTPDGKTVRTGLSKTVDKVLQDPQARDELISLLGRFQKLFEPDARELHSIVSNADTQTRWLLSKPMRDDLAKPGFDFRELRDRPTTCYVVLPAQYLRIHSVWLRLVITSALRALYRRTDGHRVWLMIDEMRALNRLSALEDAFGLVRGYGVQILGVFQDYAQTKLLYEESADSFVANAEVLVCYGPNDLTTAEWMSRRSCEADIRELTEGITFGEAGRTVNMGQQVREQNNYRLRDLFALKEGQGLFWPAGIANGRPFGGIPYWKLPCGVNAAPNPYYKDEANPRRA